MNDYDTTFSDKDIEDMEAYGIDSREFGAAQELREARLGEIADNQE